MIKWKIFFKLYIKDSGTDTQLSSALRTTTNYRWAVVLENNYIKIMYNHNHSVLYSWKSVMGYIEANIKSVMEHVLLFLCQLFVPSSSFSSHFCSSVWKFSITFLKAKNTWGASQIPATSSLRHSAAPLSHTPCPAPNQEPVHKAQKKPNPQCGMGYQHHFTFGQSL